MLKFFIFQNFQFWPKIINKIKFSDYWTSKKTHFNGCQTSHQSRRKNQAMQTRTLTTGLNYWPLPLFQLRYSLLSCNKPEKWRSWAATRGPMGFEPCAGPSQLSIRHTSQLADVAELRVPWGYGLSQVLANGWARFWSHDIIIIHIFVTSDFHH